MAGLPRLILKKGGVISPGGVGYDINCGVRLVRSDLTLDDVAPQLDRVVTLLFNDVPAGMGSKGDIRIGTKELKKNGAQRRVLGC